MIAEVMELKVLGENLDGWRWHDRLTVMCELWDSTVSVAPSELLLARIVESLMVP